MLAFFLGLEILRTAARCPIVVAHHLNKAGGYSGSRALLGRADLIIEGTDERPPWYSTIGRTIRRGDAIAERFTVDIEHLDDDDDAVAKTLVRARFASENRSKLEIGKTALRVLDLIKERGPVTTRELRGLAKIGGAKVKECLDDLKRVGAVRHDGAGWKPSLQETLEIEDDARDTPPRDRTA